MLEVLKDTEDTEEFHKGSSVPDDTEEFHGGNLVLEDIERLPVGGSTHEDSEFQVFRFVSGGPQCWSTVALAVISVSLFCFCFELFLAFVAFGLK